MHEKWSEKAKKKTLKNNYISSRLTQTHRLALLVQKGYESLPQKAKSLQTLQNCCALSLVLKSKPCRQRHFSLFEEVPYLFLLILQRGCFHLRIDMSHVLSFSIPPNCGCILKITFQVLPYYQEYRPDPPPSAAFR